MADAALPALQSWMLGAIVGGRVHPAEAAERIAADFRLSSHSRLAIYGRSYRARLVECLKGDYPALRLLVGDTVFDMFAGGYLAATPPKEWRLHEFGAGFADWLDATRPRGDDPEAERAASLPAQLARLERARAESIRAHGIETDAALPLTGDAALLPGARLRRPETVRLLRLDFDFRALIEAADAKAEPVVPEASDAPTAVTRNRWRVAVGVITPQRFAFVEAVGRGGRDVHEAAAEAGRATGTDVGAVIADLALWLPVAGQQGLLARA